MRVSIYILEYLKAQGIDTYFAVSGGGCIWLIDALTKVEGIKYVFCHHEQAAAIAAEGYARMTGKPAGVIVTSGPGGTNALTGVLGAYLDSIPMFILSGNVNDNLCTESISNLSLRQLGDQEFKITRVVKPMVKYVDFLSMVDEPSINWTLGKAFSSMIEARPGPVWIDIPLNIQACDITDFNISDATSFFKFKKTSFSISDSKIKEVFDRFILSKQPLLIIGNGIRLGDAQKELEEFLFRTKIPVITAVNGNDLVNDDYQFYCGRFGTHGQIAANQIIQKADFVLAIGTRLYVRQIGYNFKNFARHAYKVHVDIDIGELDKHTLESIDYKILTDAKIFLQKLNNLVFLNHKLDWAKKCRKLYKTTPTVLDRHRNITDYVSNYYLIERLNEYLKENDHIVTSDGGANVVTMQVVKLKGKQRLFTNTGCAAMGYGLPAAVGAAFGLKDKDRLILIEGDGSFHLNIHELQTIKHHNLPIRILLLNNNGYNSIKITQTSMMGGNLVGCTPETGISFPNFEKIVKAYDLPYMQIKNHKDIDNKIQEFLSQPGPIICEVFIDPEEIHEPKVLAKIENGQMVPGELDDITWKD